MTNEPIPKIALDDCLGFVGTRGSGKTYAAGAEVENVLNDNGRVVIADPLGVWYGLRLSSDGKHPSGFDVVIFGGPHGDMPINERAGGLLGETVATMKESAIIDLSEIGTAAGERRFMLAFLSALYRHSSGEPVHLILDEADMWAPQRINDAEGEAHKLLGITETIVRRGRVRGFVPWFITQRPAVLNKNVLSQVDGLIAMKLTSSQDRAALGAWIEGQADKEEGKAILAKLPTKKVGEAVIWLPSRGILTEAMFPPKVTFDSSRTPKRGEKKTAAKVQPLDVTKLREKLAKVEVEAKANDPQTLKAEIARLNGVAANLTKQLNVKPKGSPPVDGRAVQDAYRRGREEAEKIAVDAVRSAWREALTAMSEAVGRSVTELLKKGAPAFTVGKGVILPGPEPFVATGNFTKPPPARVERVAVRREPIDHDALPGPLQKIIDAIRYWNVFGIEKPTKQQVAFIAGYRSGSGSWGTYISRLRSNFLIEPKGDLVLTEEGVRAARDPSAVPSGESLRESVMVKIATPLQKILRPVLDAYPGALPHGTAAEAAGYAAGTGSWGTYLSRLRSLDLIERKGDLRAQGWLFP